MQKTKNIKILYCTTHLPPDNHFGGVVQSGNSMIVALKDILPKISVCYVSKTPPQMVSNNSADVVCAKSWFLHRWGFAPSFANKFTRLAKKSDISIINGIWTYPMTVAGHICRKLGKPYIVSLRGGLLPNALGRKSWRKKLFFNAFVKSIIEDAAIVHTTSQAEQDCLKTLGINTPSAIVPNGTSLPPENIDTEKHLPADIARLSPDSKVVLFLGRIAPIKGLDLLLKAWADNLPAIDRSKAMLVIAGPDRHNYTSKLNKMAVKLGINDKVIFLDMLDDLAKWALYKKADIFILPSYSESFGLVVTEAFASGTPVITTTATPWSRIANINAGLCIKPDTSDLGKAICQMLALSTEQRRVMGQNGKKMVLEEYTWDIAARKLITLCKDILNHKL